MEEFRAPVLGFAALSANLRNPRVAIG